MNKGGLKFKTFIGWYYRKKKLKSSISGRAILEVGQISNELSV